MMSNLSTAAHLDFETLSTIDISSAGVDKQVRAPGSTGIWCMSHCIAEADVDLWTPTGPEPTALLDHIADGKPVIAHNAYFELSFWNEILIREPNRSKDLPEFWRDRPNRKHWPVLRPEQLHCTMAMASSLALPASLDKLAEAIGMDYRKDKEGHALMLRMCRPRAVKKGRVTWWDTEPDRIARLHAYCIQDTVVERDACKRLLELSPYERDLWLLHVEINKRGIKIDIPLVQRTITYVEFKKQQLNDELATVTNGEVEAVTQNAGLTAWLQKNGIEHCDSVAKDAVKDMLARSDISPTVRRALELKQLAGGTATTKLPAMIDAADEDGRARGTFGFHAASTGRFSSYRIQLHNLFRPLFEYDVVEKIIDAICSDCTDDILELVYGSPLDAVSSCLRSMFVAEEGHDLISADFNNIEGRALAWLAGEDWKLQAFRDADAGTGPEIYKLTAANILSMIEHKTRTPDSITKSERQSYGKVPELALGFWGGFPAFQSMAKIYGVKVLDEFEAPREGWLSYDDVEQIKDAFRAKHPNTANFIYGMEKAAIQAIRRPGQVFGTSNGKIRFRMFKQFLVMGLPSGKKLFYYRPSLVTETHISKKTGEPYDKTAIKYWGFDAFTHQFTDGQRLTISVLAENATSGTARSCLTDAMKRLKRAGYPIVLHVHDEAVSEVLQGFGSVEEYERIMCASEPWAHGLPVAAKGVWRGKRYRKE